MPATERDDIEPTIAPPRIALTESAIEKLREMLEEEGLEEEGGLRLSARTGAGCSAPMQFGMVLEVAPSRDDIVLSGNGIRIFMNPTSAWSLDGLMVDYVDSPEMGSGFAFKHPRGTGGRAC
jgi:iron-sulfur cluster assembly accessory protein